MIHYHLHQAEFTGWETGATGKCFLHQLPRIKHAWVCLTSKDRSFSFSSRKKGPCKSKFVDGREKAIQSCFETYLKVQDLKGQFPLYPQPHPQKKKTEPCIHLILIGQGNYTSFKQNLYFSTSQAPHPYSNIWTADKHVPKYLPEGGCFLELQVAEEKHSVLQNLLKTYM